MAAVSQPLTSKPSQGGSRTLRFLKKELAPFPGRLSASSRIAIAAVLITLLGEVGRSEALFQALFVVISIPREFPKQTWKATVQYLICVWVAALVAFALDILVADIRWLRVLAAGFSVFFCLSVGRGMKMPLVGVLSAVVLTEALIRWDVSGNADANVEFVLWMCLMLSTGVLIATGVEYFYPHPSPLQRVVRGIAERLEVLHAALKRASGQPLSKEEERKACSAGKLAISGTSSLQAFLPAISSNELLDEDYVIRLSSLLMGVEVLTDIAGRLNDYSPADFNERQREQLLRLSVESALLASSVRRQDTSQSSNEPEIEPAELLDENTPAAILSHVGFVLQRLWNTWYSESFFVGDVARRSLHPPKRTWTVPGPFFTADNVRFAFKTALASMICYMIFTGVAWPGISTALITCFVVALDTVGATFRKLALRLTGVAIGGLLFGIAGISLVLSSMSNIVELLLVVAVVFFISGWVVRGSQRISYAGVQIGLSFALVALNRPTIPDQIVEARDRFVGVLLGAIVMWFVFRQLWPVNAVAEQRSQVAGLLDNVGELAVLAEEDQPIDEKADKIREFRASANQVIFLANEHADAAGFDSHYDPAVQRGLHDCLMRAESLLTLELIAAGFSVTHTRPRGTEEMSTARKEFAADYAAYLHLLGNGITNADGVSRRKEPRFTEGELQQAYERLLEYLRDMQEKGDEDARRYAEIKARILQRRSEFTRQLEDSVEKLAAATPRD